VSLLPKKLAIFSRKTIEWTGILQRTFREFVEAAGFDLGEKDLQNLYLVPDLLVDLAQSGVLDAVELEAGRDGLSIKLSSDPDGEDDTDLSMLTLCDLSGENLTVCVVLNDMRLAQALGMKVIRDLATQKLQISVRDSNKGSDNNHAVDAGSQNTEVWRLSQ